MPVNIKPINSPSITHLAIAIDSSGSMQSHRKQVVENFNGIIEALSEKAKDLGQELTVSLVTFGGKVETLFSHTPIAKVPKLQLKDFEPGGGTPMFDGALKAMSYLVAKDGDDVANVLTVLTDGEENESRYTSRAEFLAQVKEFQKTDRWTVTFSVPKGYGNTLSKSFGVPSGNVQEWDTSTEAGFKAATKSLATGYADFLTNRSKGITHSTNFYASIDANQAKAIKKKLVDVRGDFTAMTVRTQDPKTIQDFIESRGHTFAKGKSFYQLTKSETVQASKNILMREIKTGAIYGGAEAREILGLPGADIKVKPTDFSDWDIFVQSTSNNRKLVVGTNLLYLK